MSPLKLRPYGRIEMYVCMYCIIIIIKSHAPGGRLPLLSARPAVTFPAAEHHSPLAGTHFTVPRRLDG